MSTIRHILMTELWPRRVDAALSVVGAIGCIVLGIATRSWTIGLLGPCCCLGYFVPPIRRKR